MKKDELDMAKEAITKFLNKVMTDKELAERLTALATESGYDFTAEKMLEFGSARPLSDGELGKVEGDYTPLRGR